MKKEIIESKFCMRNRLTLTRPKNLLDRNISIQPHAFFKALAKVCLNGTRLELEKVGDNLLDLSFSLGINLKPGELGWILLFKSVQNSIVDIVSENFDSFQLAAKNNSKNQKTQQSEKISIDNKLAVLSERVDDILSAIETQLEESFFVKTTELKFIKDIEKSFFEWLNLIGLEENISLAISRRIPEKIVLNLYLEWSENSSKYEEIVKSLNNPFFDISKKQKDRLLYEAWLRDQPNKRVFYEAFSLNDIYINPRAFYTETASNFSSYRHVFRLEEDIISWINNEPKEDWLRVICGGPGSGKSSFLKVLSSKILDFCNSQIIFVPLHRFNLSSNLSDAMSSFVSQEKYLKENPFEPDSSQQKTVLIFDGLDELAMAGKTSAEIAYEFVDGLITSITQNINSGKNLKVLITGRDIVIQNCKKLFRSERQIYHLLPYVVSEQKKYLYKDPEELLKIDQRFLWWEKYMTVKGTKKQTIERYKSALEKEYLKEITSHPLQNYLLAISLEAGKIDFSERTTLNQIYKNLLDEVYFREYEQGRIHASIRRKDFDQKDFYRVLEEIAITVWHENGRTANIDSIEKKCPESLRNSLQTFERSAKNGILQILTAFYFRQATDTAGVEKTFEFTHKSFGEYLAARRLVILLRTIHTEIERREKDGYAGWSEKDALKHWISICGPTGIDYYLYDFIHGEIKLSEKELVFKWQSTLCKLIEWCLKYGAPMEETQLTTFKQMKVHSRNAEEGLLAMLSCCAFVTRKVSSIEWPEKTSFATWLYSMSGQQDDFDFCFAKNCLNHLDLTGCNLSGLNLFESNLSHSILVNANLSRSNIEFSSLEGADLSGANLKNTKIYIEDITSTTVIDPQITIALSSDNNRIRLADFERYLGSNDLSVELSWANLYNSEFSHSKIYNSTFDHSYFQGTSMRYVNFEGVDFEGANFEGSNAFEVISKKR